MTPAMKYLFALSATGLTLAACTPVAETADRAAGASKRAVYDTKKSWSDLFSYSPKSTTPQMPQTRYCYAMQADTLCYDSPQAGMSARMTGYQDGANVSSFQPGGGSLGVSGGEATAYFQTNEVHAAPPQSITLEGGNAVATPEAMGTTPFYSDVSMSSATSMNSGGSSYEQNAAIADQIAAQRRGATMP